MKATVTTRDFEPQIITGVSKLHVEFGVLYLTGEDGKDAAAFNSWEHVTLEEKEQ